jgi:peptidyl-prolyl cis-trans isomerase C
MSRIVRVALLGLFAVGLAGSSWGQGPQATAKRDPRADQVLATVTSRGQTDKVTRADVVRLLNQYPPVPVDEREIAYNRAIELLSNGHLLTHYLTSQRVEVPEAKIDAQIDRMKEQMKKEGQTGDLATLLIQNGTSMAAIRKDITNQLRWSEFAAAKGSDGDLRRFLNENRDRFSGTQVRASHILLRLEPSATKEQKDKARQQLAALRKLIVSGKMTFAAAANKYSQDPANASGAGGDLDYFTLDSGFVEEFANAAFKLKKGEVSEPIETPFGMHLIQVTDRKEGRLPDFEKAKPYLAQQFSMDLQKKIVTEERKTAKVDVQPLPKDLFASDPAPSGAPGVPAAPGVPPPGAAAPKQ